MNNYFGSNCSTYVEITTNQNQNIKNSSSECIKDTISMFTMANKLGKNTQSKIQDILGQSTLIIIMIILMIFRKD